MKKDSSESQHIYKGPVTDKASELSLSLKCSRTQINSKENNNLKLLCSIASGEENAVRPPVSICAIIDISSSMHTNMLVMKNCLSALVDQLRPCDLLSLVTFSNTSSTILELMHVDAKCREVANIVISQLKDCGSTYLESGLKEGIGILRKVVPSDATPTESMLLFTDGIANVGCTKYSTLKKETIQAPIEEINSMSNKMNIDRHITMSVIAFGSSPPSDLKLLSEIGDGLYYPIHTSQANSFAPVTDIPKAFSKFCGASLTYTARNIQLKIQSSNYQVKLCNPETLPYPYQLNSIQTQCTVTIPDITAGESKEFIIPIELSRDRSVFSSKSYCKTLAFITLTAHSFITQRQVKLETSAKVLANTTFDGSATSDENDVLVHLLRSKVIEALQNAGIQADLGSMEIARDKIKSMLEELVSKDFLSQDAMVQSLMGTLQVALGELRDSGMYRTRGSKLLAQLQQAHSYQRNNVIGDIVVPNNRDLIGDLLADFHLSESLDLSHYDGSAKDDINRKFTESYQFQFQSSD